MYPYFAQRGLGYHEPIAFFTRPGKCKMKESLIWTEKTQCCRIDILPGNKFGSSSVLAKAKIGLRTANPWNIRYNSICHRTFQWNGEWQSTRQDHVFYRPWAFYTTNENYKIINKQEITRKTGGWYSPFFSFFSGRWLFGLLNSLSIFSPMTGQNLNARLSQWINLSSYS